ncbi:MAG: ATPase [Gemmataceae bacterium]
MARPAAILALASYFKGNRFLQRCRQEGVPVYLLTIEKLLGEPWAREACTEVFAVKSFVDRKSLVNSVAYLMRSRKIERIVALDDFDVEVAGFLREHFRMTNVGHGESTARFFRDKLAMRQQATAIGVRVPRFTGLWNDADVNEFLANVPSPWLIKPRGEASAAGIRKLNSSDEVWKRLNELGDERSNFLLEEMVPGDLFHVDSLTHGGHVVFSEVNAYCRPLLDVYHGGGVYGTRTADRSSPDVAELRRINEQLLQGFGLGCGASHTEFMKAQRDGQMYFIETSSRVGGAHTSEMVEHATGINLWSEWANVEIEREGTYQLPATRQRFGGVVMSLSRFETPDTSSFNDPEIVERANMKSHIGFVLTSDSQARIEALLTSYRERIARDFGAAMPAQESVAH